MHIWEYIASQIWDQSTNYDKQVIPENAGSIYCFDWVIKLSAKKRSFVKHKSCKCTHFIILCLTRAEHNINIIQAVAIFDGLYIL